jgi:hypothetical protein
MNLTPSTVRKDSKKSSSSGSRLKCSTSSKQCGSACIPRNRTCRIEQGNNKKKGGAVRKVGRAGKAVANYAGPDIAASLIVGAAGFALRRGLKNRRKSYRYRQASSTARRALVNARYGSPKRRYSKPTTSRRRDSVYAPGFNVDFEQISVTL